MSRPSNKYRYTYCKSGRWLWFATMGRGTMSYRGGMFAISEKQIRRRIARFIKRQRLMDERRRATMKRN